jgi:putative CocE/NonD family hydrolase
MSEFRPNAKLAPIQEWDPVWIPLADGTRLAATIWRPVDSEARPVPAILEYLPYRRRDGTVDRDHDMHRHVAAQGYASVRVDIRGTGDSDGLLRDEYLPQEQTDAVEVIAWLAAQPWCSGSVGMIGISWGGFNGLQVAALRPPALKAIITLCSTDDRYADDCHWMGGCLLNNSIAWASTMFQYVAQSPDPAIVGDDWRKIWHHRLENLSLFAEPWLAHQQRDDYWRQGSVNEDYSAITAAVYAIGGWADGYSNAIPRLINGLPGPRKGLIGPWGHAYPHIATPGPAFDFLGEAVRWWDHWLKGQDTGIMDEPRLHLWLDHGARPQAVSSERDGTWLAFADWPTEAITTKRFLFDGKTLSTAAAPAQILTVSSPLETGITFGEWCPYGGLGELPGDQRADDGRSLSLDSAVLTDDLDIAGAALIRLRVSSDQPVASVAVRLVDVFPDGAATLVTYGVLNLTQRHGDAKPTPLTPGKYEDVTLQLNDVGYRFAAGHRLRLAISTGFWPTIWPAPVQATLDIDTAGTSLDLPIVADTNTQRAARAFPAPAAKSLDYPDAVATLPGRGRTRRIAEDPTSGTFSVEVLRSDSSYRVLKTGTDIRHAGGETYRISTDKPLSAETIAWGDWVTSRGAWQPRTKTQMQVNGTAETFELTATLQAYDGPDLFFARSYSASIPRKLV